MDNGAQAIEMHSEWHMSVSWGYMKQQSYSRKTSERHTKPYHHSIQWIIHPETWHEHWRTRKETMASASGGHLGCCNSRGKSDIISDLHQWNISVALYNGIALERRLSWLCVILEKENVACLITKLWVILLMGKDFNATKRLQNAWQCKDTQVSPQGHL